VADEDEPNPLYPVIVYFHSGAFMFGSAATYDARYLMDEEVILVTVGYRLGSFGKKYKYIKFKSETICTGIFGVNSFACI